MDFRQLEMFAAVADNLSFTHAGEQLSVAQSAISRKIKLLEDELGEKLFKRVSRKIYLTPAGEIMLRYTRRIFQDLRNAQLEVSELSQATRGSLRIGTGMTACMYLLPPVLEKFKARFPNIETRVCTGSADEMLALIRSNQVDLGVLTLPVHAADLRVIPFTTEEMVLVSSPKHPKLANRRVVKARELAEMPLIIFNRGAATRMLLDEFFSRVGIRPRIAMESESVATIKPLVQIDLGVSILPLRAVIHEAERKELHYLRIGDYDLSREIGLVYHDSDYQPKALKELIRMFRAAA
ncbi:MAG: LysR family transcriptional regulator [Bryobacteraceae bacterium]